MDKIRINKTNLKANIDLSGIKELIYNLGYRPYAEAGIFNNYKPAKRPSPVQLGIYHEYGTKKMPARPFIQPTIDKNYNRWYEAYGTFVYPELVTFKKASTIKLKKLMERMSVNNLAYDIKYTIDTMKRPPLAQSTIDRKGRATLLKDTEIMYNNIKGKGGVKRVR